MTAVLPTADGFISVRPEGTPGEPTTSNLNFAAGDIAPNAVTVALPASGRIELTYSAFGTTGPTTDTLVDITGFYVEAADGGPPGPVGPAGPAGPAGPVGPAGVIDIFGNTTIENVNLTSSARGAPAVRSAPRE